MIDVHCHLADNKFKTDVDEVIKNALECGVTSMVAVAEFSTQFEMLLDLHERHEQVLIGIGVHPIQKRNKCVKEEHFHSVENFLAVHHEKISCIGEIGLDHTFTQFKLTENDLKTQEEVFRRQIDLALHYQLPVNVHSRSAAEHTVKILSEYSMGPDMVLLHAFDGDSSSAQRALDLGYSFSIPPSFQNSDRAKAIIEMCPIERILLETDSPALSPRKGERNEPKNLEISAKIISKVKNMTVEDVIEETTKNASKMFSFTSRSTLVM